MSITGTIQGENARLSFFKNAFVPFMCATDISIGLSSDELPIRTIGDGEYKKVTYQNKSYAITLSGILLFSDDDHWTGWDMIDNWFHFSHVRFQCSFDDLNGNVRSLEGYAMVKTSTISWSPGGVVKDNFELVGNGGLKIYDGLVACGASIDSVIITGETSPDGIIVVSYTFSGDLYQVKYRFDDTGDYSYALSGASFEIDTLANGAHSVEMIPVCTNGYEGEPVVTDFVITRALSCTLAITSITHVITDPHAAITLNFNTDPAGATLKYRTDGGAWVTYGAGLATPMTIILTFTPGAHAFEAIPICSNGVEGTGNTDSFTTASGGTTSNLDYNFVAIPGGTTSFKIYIGGVLSLNLSATGSGTLVAMTGQSVQTVLVASTAGRNCDLTIDDTTTAVTLTDQNATAPTTLSYTFTASSGDEYNIHGVISP